MKDIFLVLGPLDLMVNLEHQHKDYAFWLITAYWDPKAPWLRFKWGRDNYYKLDNRGPLTKSLRE